ncbi:MAG: S1 RNA-binding domain-containing protein [Oscillospiraceae bacterium]|nr:S1 RNA-binding domain-containing protein [Oscillospiraceae bacterium]
MELAIGTVLEGKVKTITKFGAFIALPENLTGMVHISEVAHTYVSDIREHLTEGQEVKVMVISNENGKINLSIKKTSTPPPRQPRPAREAPAPRQEAPAQSQSFDDMLKRFMADSDSKISGLREFADHKTKTRRR